MTRTYKDNYHRQEKTLEECTWYGLFGIECPSFRKLKKHGYTTLRFMPTPAWWWRMTTTKRRRRENRVWEHKVLLNEELEPHLNWKKPQEYYW